MYEATQAEAEALDDCVALMLKACSGNRGRALGLLHGCAVYESLAMGITDSTVLQRTEDLIVEFYKLRNGEL